MSAADCLPRLSPPSAPPAFMAAISRRANDFSFDVSNVRAVAATTSGPASILPATDTLGRTTCPHTRGSFVAMTRRPRRATHSPYAALVRAGELSSGKGAKPHGLSLVVPRRSGRGRELGAIVLRAGQVVCLGNCGRGVFTGV